MAVCMHAVKATDRQAPQDTYEHTHSQDNTISLGKIAYLFSFKPLADF